MDSSAAKTLAMSLEFPSGPVPLNSPFYMGRPPIEDLAYQEVSKPGSVIRIQAPRNMGKSSLLARIMAYAAAAGYQTVSLDLQQADETVFTNLDKFLRWFCANVSRQMNLKPMLDDYWDEDIGSKVSCTMYFRSYLLKQIDSPLVVALNEVNRVFEYPKIAQDFLPLLRSWHEEAKHAKILQKLRLVVVHSTEIYIPLNINQSPFNVGLPIKLPQFTLSQVQDLAICYGLDWADGKEAGQLMAMVGGHPYLVQLALYHLVNPPQPPLERGGKWGGLEQILHEAPTLAGIYSNHLRSHLATIQEHPELAAALKQVVATHDSVRLEPKLTFKLESMGLVKLNGDSVTPSCELYRLYFGSQLLGGEDLRDSRIQQLEKENQELQELVNIDDLTQIANRRHLDKVLFTEWRRLTREVAPLSLILCDIDFFKIYNDTYGHPAGDDCLRQIASAIRECLKRPADLVARSGGEEFVVILPQTNAVGAVHIAEKIRQRVQALEIARDEFCQDGFSPFVTISLGVASTIPNNQIQPERLVAAADEALYYAKRLGRNRVALSSTWNFGAPSSS